MKYLGHLASCDINDKSDRSNSDCREDQTPNMTAFFLHTTKYDDEDSDHDGFEDEDDVSNGWPDARLNYLVLLHSKSL